MRVEWALIAGIVGFCCWCAYILITMSSTLGSAGSQLNPQQQQAAASLEPATGQPLRPEVAPTKPLGAADAKSSSLRQRSTEAPQLINYPPAAGLRPPYLPQEKQQQQQPTYWPSHRPSMHPFPVNQWRSAASDYSAVRPLDSRWQQQQQPQMGDQFSESAPPPEVEPERPEGDDDGEEAEAEEEDEPPAREEVDTSEGLGARSYDRQESEANERDREGRPVRVHRRLLVNGKPVKPPTKSVAEAENDFEALVNELDPDEEPEPEASDEDYGDIGDKQPAESRVSTGQKQLDEKREKTRGLQAKRGATSGGRRPKEFQRHKLSESLRAQQWDDDSVAQVNTNNNDTTIKNEVNDNSNGRHLAELEDVERDTEAPANEASEEPDDADSEEPADRRMDSIGANFNGHPQARGSNRKGIKKKRISRLRRVDGKEETGNSKRLNLRRHKRQVSVRHDATPKIEPYLYHSPEQKPETDSSPLNSLTVNIEPKLVDGKTSTLPQTLPELETSSSAANLVNSHITGQPNSLSGSRSGYPQTKPIDEFPVVARDWGHLPERVAGSRRAISNNSMSQRLPTSRPKASGSGHLKPRATESKNRKRFAKEKKKKKKKRKKHHMSKMNSEKQEAAKLHKSKAMSRSRKTGKRRRQKLAKDSKMFEGSVKGKKSKKGAGEKGANKGALYYKDKGYKRRGFKKSYRKLEEGDQKTYFDEFRDKDHNKKWKNFKNKHRYSQSNNWAGKEKRKRKNVNSSAERHKKKGTGSWKHTSDGKYKQRYKYKDGYRRDKKIIKRQKKKRKSERNVH